MISEFSHRTRIHNIVQMREETFDLLIIGGGITGAGVARDAASRGMKVALIEAKDFASGTSSRSSKLIHGGIRYLENFEFHLVFEALTERRHLFEMAPHLVHPLRFVIPVYNDSRVGMFKLGLGMWAYDFLSCFEMPEFHERLSAQQTQSRIPFINSEGLKGSFVYSDAYMDDDRLVIETLRSAHSHGAKIANYVSAEQPHYEGEGIASVECKDHVTGETFAIKCRHVVSSVGPWTDRVGSVLTKSWKKILRPSKGIHLIVPKDRLPLQQAVVMAVDKEDRIIFGIPRPNMVIVGTTDTDYPADPSNVHSTKEDVDYLLAVVNNYFPGVKLTTKDVISSYAGVRPLVDDGSSTESKTSREHVIFQSGPNLTFVSGGKYTTYRRIAEDVVKSVLSCFSTEEQVRYSVSQTRSELNSLVTQTSFDEICGRVGEIAEDYSWPVDQTEEVVRRFGAEAEKILAYPYKNPASRWTAEAHFAIENTMCMHVDDFYLRRTPLFLSMADHGMIYVDEIASVFQNKLRNESSMEKMRLQKHLALELAWKN